MKHSWRLFAPLLAALVLAGCMDRGEGLSWQLSNPSVNAPSIPEGLEIGEDGLPVLTVYDKQAGELAEMDVETYVAGVVAGEMKNDWPTTWCATGA